GAGAVDQLLVLSQVVLSLQLSFAVVPLIAFTSDREKMGEFVNPKWVVFLAGFAAAIILALNANLVVQEVTGWLAAAGSNAVWLWLSVVPIGAGAALMLAYITAVPLLQRFAPALVRRAPEVFTVRPSHPARPVAVAPAGGRPPA